MTVGGLYCVLEGIVVGLGRFTSDIVALRK